MTLPRLLAVGGAHIDRHGRMTGPYMPGASNPGVLVEAVGGAVFNALRAAARHSIKASLISLRGGDAAGEMVARALAEVRIDDMSAIFLDRATPSHTALLDRDGALIAALADMRLYDMAFAKQIARSKVRDAVKASDAVLCDANVPEAGLELLATLSPGKPLFGIATSPVKAARMSGILRQLACLFMNAQEAAGLAGLEMEDVAGTARRLKELGLQRGVITVGYGDVLGFDAEGAFSIFAPPPRTTARATGTGDALAGATIAALLHGAPLRSAIRQGLAAAMLASKAGVSATYSNRAFAEMLALVPEAQELV
jgi:pseudouridine kinase